MKKIMTAAEMGKKGGTARAKRMTKKQLSKAGKYAADCRWGKVKR